MATRGHCGLRNAQRPQALHYQQGPCAFQVIPLL